jgi:polyphosphate kinase
VLPANLAPKRTSRRECAAVPAEKLESRRHWVDYSKAKDVMFAHTDTKKAPWYVVNADNKKRARLNCIAHLLQHVPYQDMVPVEVELPSPQFDESYKRPKMSSQCFVPEIY